MKETGLMSNEGVKAQSAEFEAMANLAEQWRRLSMTAVVEDDYPAVRHDWEGALAAFVEAMAANGRFEPQSRLGMILGRTTPVGVHLGPDELLSLVRSAQYEVNVRRTFLHMRDTSQPEKRAIGARLHVLREWLTSRGFSTGEEG